MRFAVGLVLPLWVELVQWELSPIAHSLSLGLWRYS